MDLRRLKEAQRRFLLRYPAGFLDPELRAVGMKHAVAKRSAFAQDAFADALFAMLHGDQAAGFEDLVRLLARGKLAKWPIITALLLYYRPRDEVFIKPTTVKRVSAYVGLTGLDYRPR